MADPNVEKSKELVLQAMPSVFVDRDLSASGKYWAGDYIPAMK
jgi:hypothetical protein